MRIRQMVVRVGIVAAIAVAMVAVPPVSGMGARSVHAADSGFEWQVASVYSDNGAMAAETVSSYPTINYGFALRINHQDQVVQKQAYPEVEIGSVSGQDSYYFESMLWASRGGAYASMAELWDMTLNRPVANSVVTTRSMIGVVKRSGPITLIPGDIYTLALAAPDGGTAFCDSARIVGLTQ